MLFGEKMPDRNDPKYKERYERDLSAGRRFARATRLDKLAAKIQGFANRNRVLFLILVFGFVIATFSFNICRLAKVYRHGHEVRSATEMQDSLLRERNREDAATPVVEPHKPGQR